MTRPPDLHLHRAQVHEGEDCAPALARAIGEAAACPVGRCSVQLCHNPATLSQRVVAPDSLVILTLPAPDA